MITVNFSSEKEKCRFLLEVVKKRGMEATKMSVYRRPMQTLVEGRHKYSDRIFTDHCALAIFLKYLHRNITKPSLPAQIDDTYTIDFIIDYNQINRNPHTSDLDYAYTHMRKKISNLSFNYLKTIMKYSL